MNLAYINKTTWLSNMPSTVFSTMNALAFAENYCDTTLFLKEKAKNNIETFESYFNIKQPDNLHIHLENDRFLFLKSNEIFYKNINKWLIESGKKWDIIITRDPGYLPFLVKLKEKLGVKAFYQSHNFYLDLKFQPEQKKINQKKFHKNEINCLKRIDGILALNNPHKELYERYLTTKVFAGYPGLNKVHEPNDNFNEQTVFYSGSFQAMKGMELLVKAFSLIKNKEARLVLAGGRNQNEINFAKSIIDSNKLSERTEITGWLSFAELERRIEIATIGVIPLQNTFYNQYLTAPSKLFDYLAFGIPVIASDLPSIRDLTAKYKAAILVEPDNPEALADAIDKILADKQIYNELCRKSIRAARNYLWKNCAKRMLEFMESV